MDIMNLTTVTIRDVLRGHKEIFKKVAKSPVIITQRNKPEVAIINLNDLEILQKQKELMYTQNLINLADESNKYNVHGPNDLSVNHDNYMWNKD